MDNVKKRQALKKLTQLKLTLQIYRSDLLIAIQTIRATIKKLNAVD